MPSDPTTNDTYEPLPVRAFIQAASLQPGDLISIQHDEGTTRTRVTKVNSRESPFLLKVAAWPVPVATQAATSYEIHDGRRALVFKCTNCGKEMSRKEVSLAQAIGPSYEESGMAYITISFGDTTEYGRCPACMSQR